MSKKPDNVWRLSDTITLCEYVAPDNWHYQSGKYGFWLYDKTQSMNLAMRAKTEQAAFVEAIAYYQRRLKEIETSYGQLKEQVNSFVAQFTDEEKLRY